VGKTKGKRPLGKPKDVGGWIILKWILEKLDEAIWNGFIWLRIETIKGLLWMVINLRTA
jgi:hypothetical protein